MKKIITLFTMLIVILLSGCNTNVNAIDITAKIRPLSPEDSIKLNERFYTNIEDLSVVIVTVSSRNAKPNTEYILNVPLANELVELVKIESNEGYIYHNSVYENTSENIYIDYLILIDSNKIGQDRIDTLFNESFITYTSLDGDEVYKKSIADIIELESDTIESEN